MRSESDYRFSVSRRVVHPPSVWRIAAGGSGVDWYAVAAGALLLLGCDYRVGVDGPVKIGLNR